MCHTKGRKVVNQIVPEGPDLRLSKNTLLAIINIFRGLKKTMPKTFKERMGKKCYKNR